MSRPGTSREHVKTKNRIGLDFPTPILCTITRHKALSLLIAIGWMGGAWAAAPGDPTEAPPAWIAAQPVATQPGVAPATVGETSIATPTILTGRSKRLAVIDGRIVKVGDDYNGSKVVAIESNRVVMEDAAKSLDAIPGVKKNAPVRAKTRKESVVIPTTSLVLESK